MRTGPRNRGCACAGPTPRSAAFKAGVDTGAINNVNLSSMHGIAQVSNNTGIASQANNIALNAIVK